MSSYGFEVKDKLDGESEHTVKNQNIAKMQDVCSKTLDLSFSEDLFELVQKWCSVKKKIGWMVQFKNPKMRPLSLDAADANKDEADWGKNVDTLKKDSTKREKIGIKQGEESVENLKNKCLSFRSLVWSENKDKAVLFREFCMKVK